MTHIHYKYHPIHMVLYIRIYFTILLFFMRRFIRTSHLPTWNRSRPLRGELQRPSHLHGALRRALRAQERVHGARAVAPNAAATGLRSNAGTDAAHELSGLGDDGLRAAAGQSQHRQVVQFVLLVRQRDQGKK